MSDVEIGATGFPLWQQDILVHTERIASCISVIGCLLVIFTFLWSARFRKPVNRLIFYAVWGNLLFNVATLISINGMELGFDAPLCQFQGFLVQIFLPADAFWNLSMAINTYLTVFRKYNAAQCRAMEKWYLLVNYGVFTLIAFVYCFVQNSSQGKMYGGAVLWCWVRGSWSYVRVATCYAPAWLAILTSFIIYVAAGRRLMQREKKFSNLEDNDVVVNPFTSFKTTEVHITSEVASPRHPRGSSSESQIELRNHINDRQYIGRGDCPEYTITIERDAQGRANQRHMLTNEDEIRARNAAVSANKAAKSYVLCCSLFFASLLVSWTPSSVFRVWTLFNPPTSNFPMAYVTGLVLPLMGFWNAVIYITISWDAVLDMFAGDIDKRVWKAWHNNFPNRKEWSNTDRKSKDSWGTRTRRLSLNSKDEIEAVSAPVDQVVDAREGRSWLRD